MANFSVSLTSGSRSLPIREDYGLGLVEWPKWFDGLQRAHTWDPEGGSYREEVPAGVQQVELSVRAKSGNITAAVDRLLRFANMEPLSVAVYTGSGGVRSMPVRLVEVGDVQWYPMPHTAVFAEVGLRFETVTGYWTGQERWKRFTAAEIKDGVQLPYQGDLPDWPTIKIAGGHKGVKVFLRKGDEPQNLPENVTGWTIRTDPAARGVVDGNGKAYKGSVPFWPEPPTTDGDVMYLGVQATSPATSFRVEVSAQEKWRRAWA